MNKTLTTLLLAVLFALLPTTPAKAANATPGKYSGTVKVVRTIPSLGISSTVTVKLSALLGSNGKLSILVADESNYINDEFGFQARLLVGTVDLTGTSKQFSAPKYWSFTPIVTMSGTTMKFTATLTDDFVADDSGDYVSSQITYTFSLRRTGA